jgi:hypothetical protein
MRWLPMVAMAEIKGTMPQADPHRAASHDDASNAVGHVKAALAPEGAE